MLKFSEIFEFEIPILKEFEWFEWFGPSPIEPFNSGRDPAGVVDGQQRVRCLVPTGGAVAGPQDTSE